MVSSNQIVINILFDTEPVVIITSIEKKPGVFPSLSLASQTLYRLGPPVRKIWSPCPK